MPLGANAVCDESIADKFGTERTPRQNARKKQAIEIDRIRMDFWGLQSTMTGSTMSMTIFPRNLHGGSTPCRHLLLSELAADMDPVENTKQPPTDPRSSKSRSNIVQCYETVDRHYRIHHEHDMVPKSLWAVQQ
jgi:hypothetical protein